MRIRASTSKSIRPREIAIPLETLKELDRYLRDFRKGDTDEDAPLFTGRRGGPLTAQAVKRLFDRLKVRTGIRDLCAHMLRHTWATIYSRSGTGTSFDLQVEGGWTTPRMVDHYCKQRPLAERRRAPSPFSAPRAAILNSEKRPAEMRPPQQRNVPALRRVRLRPIETRSVARTGFEPVTFSLKGMRSREKAERTSSAEINGKASIVGADPTRNVCQREGLRHRSGRERRPRKGGGQQAASPD